MNSLWNDSQATPSTPFMSAPAPTCLRVCYLVSYFHPFASGAERQALAQGIELVRLGHVVHVVTREVPGYPVVDEEVEGVSIHRWIRTSTTGPLFGLSFVASAIAALRRLRGEYDVIHTHQALWEAVATGLGRGFFGGAPTLVQPASSGYYGEADELARTRGFPFLRRLILRNTAFAAISEDIEQQWRGLGVAPERIARMASGVDAERFHPGVSAFEGALLPRPRVVFTGRLHRQKNLDLLLDAWPEVTRRTPANLILVGRGAERERLEERARTLQISDRVQFMGPLDDLTEILRAADLFVLPSLAEGMSNSLLEAMATGLPCLATAIGGNSDLLRHGSAGVLLPKDDPKAWSDTIVQLVEDQPLARSLGAAARSQVETEYALPIVVSRYVELYRRLIARTWPAAPGA